MAGALWASGRKPGAEMKSGELDRHEQSRSKRPGTEGSHFREPWVPSNRQLETGTLPPG